MAITIKCTCGKSLKADEKYLGKKAKCPACGTSVLIEDQSASKSEPEAPKKKSAPPPDDDDDRGSKVQSEAPRKKPAARKDDDDDDDDPEPRKPIKRQEEPKKSNMMMYVLGGCGALLVLTCCFTGLGTGLLYMMGWWPFGGTSADMVYVHDGVVGFISYQVADGFNHPSAKDMPAEVKKSIEELESKFGLKTTDVERATVVVRSLPANLFAFGGGPKEPPDIGVIVKTTKAMDEKKILAAIAEKSGNKEKEVKHDGATYFVFNKPGGGDDGAMHFVNKNIVLFGPNDRVLKDMVKQSKNAPKHAAIARGVQMASAGKHAMVAAFEAKKLFGMIPAGGQFPVDGIREANGVVISTKLLDKEAQFDAYLTFASKDAATKGKADMDKLVPLFQVGAKGGFAAVPPQVTKFVDSLKVELQGSDVVVSGKMDTDLKELFAPGMGIGPGGGGFPNGKKIGGIDPPLPIQLAAQRQQSSNNLRQIILAIHTFHDTHKGLPNHAIRHPQTGQELLSWRVAILPYLEQNALYRQIKLDERWDSPHNRQFWNRMPATYKLPGKFDLDRTYDQVFHGPASAFPKTNRPPGGNPLTGDMRMTSITDGLSNTIFVVEASTSGNWMAPDDIPFVMGDIGLRNRVGNHWTNLTFLAAMGDGTVRPMRRTMTQQNLQGLITRAGNEVVNPDE